MNFKKNIFYAVLTGATLAISFPPMPLFLLAFGAFIPLLTALDSQKQKHDFLLIYIAFFVYHVGTNWWISSWQPNTDIYLFISGIVLCFFHPLFFLIPFAFYFGIQRVFDKICLKNNFDISNSKKISLWLFPFIWVAFEWFHSLGDLSYPWLNIGYTQVTNIYWIQLVDITGIYGASFLIALVNILIYKILTSVKQTSSVAYKKNKNTTWKNYINTIQNKIFIVLIYIILIVPMLYGYIIIKNYNYNNDLKNNNFLNIGLVQANIDPWEKWKNDVYSQIKTHLDLQDSLVEKIGKINLFLWSETAIPTINLSVNCDLELDFIEENLAEKDIALLTGFAQYKSISKNEKYIPVTARYLSGDSSLLFYSHNSALLLNPKFDNYRNIISNKQIYHKSKLTPFAEGFPFVEYLSFAKDWVSWGVGISSWERGKIQKNLVLNKENIETKIAPIICIESIYPDFVRKFVSDGANIISVITNDAWYNYTFGPEQHYIISKVRAIENRRYLARCANSGISGFISPIGKDILRATQYKTTAVAASIPLLSEQTFYTKHGDFLPIISLITILLIIIFYWSYSKFKSN